MAGRGKAGSSAQKKLRALGVPVPVLGEPREWYVRHRKPSIVETDRARGRLLVEFRSRGVGSFGGTCLYARREGQWGCYTIKPSASESIAAAEAWLIKSGWDDWR